MVPQILKFLEPVLERSPFDVTPEVTEPEARFADFENPDLVISFTGPDVDLLLENKAELLLALEHLTMESLRLAPNEHARLIFDANDYRMLRIEELRLSAVTAAEKVKTSRRPFRFDPMTSRERRILHLAVRDISRRPQRELRRRPASRCRDLSRRHAVAAGKCASGSSTPPPAVGPPAGRCHDSLSSTSPS